VAKLLIDECLHTSLLKLEHEAGHTADHVNYLGLGRSKDWDLMKLILDRDYTFVTNPNRLPGTLTAAHRCMPVW
jgi:predicted nuclease of predicted toxin-antitoxin system